MTFERVPFGVDGLDAAVEDNLISRPQGDS
jgi:hypothetical protein